MSQPIKAPFDFSGKPLREAVSQIRYLESKLSPEDLQNLKYEIMRPYRTRNIIVGLGLCAFCVGVYGFAYFKTKPDDFENIPLPAIKI